MAKRAKSKSESGGTFADRVKDVPPPPATRAYPAPVALGSILGQDHALHILRSAIAADRIHHAWIFHGPKGVGKFTAALAFAAMIMDPTTAPGLTGEAAPDPESPVARMLAAGTHPDLHVITKELARYHDDASVRDSKQRTIAKEVVEEHLIIPATKAPQVRNDAKAAKVFIVDEAELLDRSTSHAPTQNSILKTLEEPDGKTVIILVTSSVDRLLTTIRSRSQQVRFGPLDPTAMKHWLANQDLGVDRDHAAWLIQHAEGSPGELLAAKDLGLYAWHQELAPMLASASRGKYVLGLGPKIAELIESAAEAAVKANPQASKEAANRAAASRLFKLISRFFRDQLRTGLPRNVDATYHDVACRAIDAVRKAEQLLDAQVNLAFVGEWLSAELVASAEPAPV